MSQEVDWLHSQAGVCKVDLYNPGGGKDQERKVICFVDVSSLNIKQTDDTDKDAAGQSKSSESATGLDLGKMQDKEVIVIKDSDTPEQSKTEGAVCLFKQGSTEELNVVSWLFDDLQKYACGFQHALSPSTAPPAQKPSAADKMSQNNNNTAFKPSEGQKTPSDEVACTVQKLCALVMQMASKEISENLEDAASKCIRQAIYASKDGKALNPSGSVSKVASKMVNDVMENAQDANKDKKEEGKGLPKKTSLFYGELCSNQSESCPEEEGRPTHAHLIHPRKQMSCNDGTSSFNKGLMVYANKNAKDMTFSFVNATKIHKRPPLPACVILKRVFLKHTKDVISDLIDSTMKNLHNVTGVLMTDSDFVTMVKKNLFNAGTQKSTEILEAMVLRMYNALMSDTKDRGHSLVYSLLKTGCSLDPNSPNMHFASLKGGVHMREKVRQDGQSSAQKVGETIIKDGISMLRSRAGGKGSDRGCHDKRPEKSNSTTEFLAKDLILTALMLIQQHLLTQYKEPVCESNTSSFGFYEKGGKHGSKSHSFNSRSDPQQQEYQRGEIQSALLSIIQKVLQEAGFNVDECEISKNTKSNSYDDRSSRKPTSKQNSSDVDCENMEQINKKFIDQLMESVMKLCMYMTKSPDFVVEDYSDEQGTYITARNKGMSTPDSMLSQKPPRTNIGKPLVPAGSEVIVNNQSSNTSSQNRELQAVLQWMAASHFQVPNLTFMNENDDELKKLPQLADKAAKKGASVGDILQEVMKYFEKQQVDAAVGNMPRCGLLDWLLANL
ncbi:A-kinase anchor protein 4-like [Pantherophis guttatus]|uniref:A-kinase anchor protein 4-like n=1 Tax=Pantherophis guttatus TaxID=94885 RepID=A0A6P9DH25_PANGU|nr:A-kinase anchor protein 4-like [Pantherophis guttatus]